MYCITLCCNCVEKRVGVIIVRVRVKVRAKVKVRFIYIYIYIHTYICTQETDNVRVHNFYFEQLLFTPQASMQQKDLYQDPFGKEFLVLTDYPAMQLL